MVMLIQSTIVNEFQNGPAVSPSKANAPGPCVGIVERHGRVDGWGASKPESLAPDQVEWILVITEWMLSNVILVPSDNETTRPPAVSFWVGATPP